jgi:flagellar assembly factor FliW
MTFTVASTFNDKNTKPNFSRGHMNNSSLPVSVNSDAKQQMAGTLEINSRFGPVSIQLESAIYFPQGLVGMPNPTHFAITNIPKEGMGNFKLLQCVTDSTLSFVVLPLKLDNPFIEKADIINAAKLLDIAEERLLTMLIVSVQKTPEKSRVTANLRAPIMIDISDKAGIQYVYSNSKYEICKVLS